MDKNAIKKYAVWARRELISRVSQKALQYGITEKDIVPASATSVNGVVLSNDEIKQRKALIEQINKKGYEQVMEEVAYTWFNRFSALRFMEVNGYLPSHVRVFTDEDNNFKPQILAEAINLELDGLDMEKVYALKDANDDDALFKYLVIVQCNALSPILPGMFQRIADYTELLFPDNLLRKGSVIDRLVDEIPEDNFDVKAENGQIEIIGWLYQYYISEKHEEVIDPLHGKETKKEEVPAATQLFTTDWVVRYVVDNSVGHYWIERNPNSRLKDELEYLVCPKNGSFPIIKENVTPQEITVFDPCVGSGHFLVYAFEVLMKIYVEYGYTEREAAREILRNNLFGLDIDNRAAQLAYFAVMMKARQYDRSLFRQGIAPHIHSIIESNYIDSYAIDEFCADASIRKDIKALMDIFCDAQEYGSILRIPSVDFDKLEARVAEMQESVSMVAYALEDIYEIIRIAKLMSTKYSAVVTNPPYLGKYDTKLKEFVLKYYKEYSSDLFSIFMYRNFGYTKENGYSGFMTPSTWMAATQHLSLRGYIYREKGIETFVQMAKGAFFKEATVDVCAFVFRNSKDTRKGLYIRLDAFKGDMEVQRVKTREAIVNPNCGYFYEISAETFEQIPGKPLAYWISEQGLSAFSRGTLKSRVETKQGFKTGNNDLFLRLWHEVATTELFLGEDKDNKKWFPCNKGGAFRKWYGNREYVVDWELDGFRIINYKDAKGKQLSRPQNISYNFREALTWSTLSSGPISFRYSDPNMMFESKGSECFMKNAAIYEIQGLLNSKVSMYYLAALAPTIDYSEGSILKIPYVSHDKTESVEAIVKGNIEMSKADWDSFETSWDFRKHPLVPTSHEWAEQRHSQFADTRVAKFSQLAWHYEQWEQACKYRFDSLKENEEELNRIFIDIYGLQDELTPDVADDDVTVRLADKKRDIKSLISYAVGCMFGRYSLDVEGLAYAGGEWDDSKYVTFKADKDNIIPICDDEYFPDDIVGRFMRFIEVVYGKETRDENLRFIADALGGSGQPVEVIRNYFLNDFYTDHLKIYQKRPIYWLFDSGKKNGFKALVYMHRYQPDTIARMRTDYVHEQQSRYRTAIADIEQRIASASTSERVKLNKKLKTLQDQATEIQTYEEKIHHLADQYISIDLDDGVKKNYAIFGDVLAKIK